MKILRITLSVFFFVIMVGLTATGFFPSISRFGFAGGSTESLMEIATANIILQTFLLLLSGYFLYKYLKEIKLNFLIAFSAVFILWFLSGRTIGIIIFPEGRVNTGWFYLPTNRFNVCDHETDCEKVIYYQTTIEKIPLWRVRIKNNHINRVIFVGPIIWTKTLKMMENKFGAGKFTSGEIGNLQENRLN